MLGTGDDQYSWPQMSMGSFSRLVGEVRFFGGFPDGHPIIGGPLEK